MAEHNLPFAVADNFNSLVPKMFPDSKIAAEFACATTKTAALKTHALAPAANEPVVNPQRAFTARVTVVGLCVCLSVCYSTSNFSHDYSCYK